MVEANPTKFYFAKYFFLCFAFIQWIVAASLLLRFDFTVKNFFIALVFFTLGLTLLIVFSIVSEKIKRVAIGKNKIVILEGHRNTRFEWPEVKSIKIIPLVHLYKLRLKGKKNSIYFFPSENIYPAFGILAKDTSKMGDIVEKRKKEHGIK